MKLLIILFILMNGIVCAEEACFHTMNHLFLSRADRTAYLDEITDHLVIASSLLKEEQELLDMKLKRFREIESGQYRVSFERDLFEQKIASFLNESEVYADITLNKAKKLVFPIDKNTLAYQAGKILIDKIERANRDLVQARASHTLESKGEMLKKVNSKIDYYDSLDFKTFREYSLSAQGNRDGLVYGQLSERSFRRHQNWVRENRAPLILLREKLHLANTYSLEEIESMIKLKHEELAEIVSEFKEYLRGNQHVFLPDEKRLAQDLTQLSKEMDGHRGRIDQLKNEVMRYSIARDGHQSSRQNFHLAVGTVLLISAAITTLAYEHIEALQSGDLIPKRK